VSLENEKFLKFVEWVAGVFPAFEMAGVVQAHQTAACDKIMLEPGSSREALR